ncbi:chromobox protein 2 like [Crotalus adamanteus]|uniref:Chromobox protein 2 like n=1 Tax=Crotalus adamanteus TaxID=8729 RepID=A0AAW1BXX1_CROAD
MSDAATRFRALKNVAGASHECGLGQASVILPSRFKLQDTPPLPKLGPFVHSKALKPRLPPFSLANWEFGEPLSRAWEGGAGCARVALCALQVKLWAFGGARVPAETGGGRRWQRRVREHEKEVQNRKRGKRPRGRPRKNVEPEAPSRSKSSSSSSSTSSSTSSSDEEEESDLETKRSQRNRESHPVPQKKAQILVAKPENKDSARKKRGRKPLPPEQKAAKRTVNLTKVLKTNRKELGGGGGAKLASKMQPQHSAQSSGIAMLKSHMKEAQGAFGGFCSGASSNDNLSSIVKNSTVGSPNCGISWQSSIVHYMSRMSQNQSSADASAVGRLTLKSAMSCKSNLGLDLKLRNQKGSGNLELTVQGSKVTKRPSGNSLGEQKTGNLHNGNKVPSGSPSTQPACNQELNLQALNLQSVKNGPNSTSGSHISHHGCGAVGKGSGNSLATKTNVSKGSGPGSGQNIANTGATSTDADPCKGRITSRKELGRFWVLWNLPEDLLTKPQGHNDASLAWKVLQTRLRRFLQGPGVCTSGLYGSWDRRASISRRAAARGGGGDGVSLSLVREGGVYEVGERRGKILISSQPRPTKTGHAHP